MSQTISLHGLPIRDCYFHAGSRRLVSLHEQGLLLVSHLGLGHSKKSLQHRVLLEVEVPPHLSLHTKSTLERKAVLFRHWDTLFNDRPLKATELLLIDLFTGERNRHFIPFTDNFSFFDNSLLIVQKEKLNMKIFQVEI